MKYRIKFAKVGKTRFIGHLDLLKVFQRAIKRAEIPVAYSKGFNPHQLIGFAAPLPLGMAGKGEYVDIELREEFEPDDIVFRLNEVMPEGLEIIEVRKLEKNEKNCAASVESAVYEIEFSEKIDRFDYFIDKMMREEKLEIERKSKRKTKVVDIKPDIFSVENISDENCTRIKVVISAGSQRNLKPELLVEYIYGYIGKSFEPLAVKYKRIELIMSIAK